jgi:glycosyltransferase involved in cell wall biosynthesis
MVHTLHTWPHEDEASLWAMSPDACVTAISNCQWSEFPEFTPAATIYHGVDASQFTFRQQPEDYVCYLGNFNWSKGPTFAIKAARELGLRLLLAGPGDQQYHELVEPLVDGRLVEYVGYVSGRERNELLGGARALLYPIQYQEPFGLVQVEAMMCGTPVAAIRLGAVSEIIDEGVTGYCAASTLEFGQAVLRTLMLDRRNVRDQAEARFSAERMARQYLGVYENLVSRERPASRRQLERVNR